MGVKGEDKNQPKLNELIKQKSKKELLKKDFHKEKIEFLENKVQENKDNLKKSLDTINETVADKNLLEKQNELMAEIDREMFECKDTKKICGKFMEEENDIDNIKEYQKIND